MIFNMKVEDVLKKLSREQLKTLSKQDLIELLIGEQDIREQLENLRQQAEEEKILIGERYVLVKRKMFGASSEKMPPPKNSSKSTSKKNRDNFSKNLRERYPNIEEREEVISLETPPICSCCQSPMVDSGMTEDSEYLTVEPKKYILVIQKRQKYRCGKCHGEIQTAPALPRIAPGSSYSDEVILDVSLSKYCDLLPVERYAKIAERLGVKNLPSNSLIGLTHHLSDFVLEAYRKLAAEVKTSRVIKADETPHRMLEGDEKSNWYLWGFSSEKASYFEFHDTRSGEVASEFLKNSDCKFLLSDVFSGYARAVSDANKYRTENNLELMVNVYCNAHARRKFDEAKHPFQNEATFYLEKYQEIYKLEKETSNKSPEEIIKIRSQMIPLFQSMKEKCAGDLNSCSNRSSLAKAINYFLNNFDEFTKFIITPEIPIDNNSQERALRNPVIGRKTWYGTHSKRGAETAAILFSIMESCKLSKVNPREYLKNLVQDLHAGKNAYTPKEYADLAKNN